ncbi:MAG: tetratricopeptide repeat protein [Proteobacteria bacterium]|nr:tetratricopeptide repeat protein [Pseudomonadota bacterium]
MLAKLIKILFFVGCLSFTKPLPASTDSDGLILSQYYISVADRLYETQELPGNLEMSLSFYKKALPYSHLREDIEWKLARCFWTLAEQTGNHQKKAIFFKKGIQYGNDAVSRHPKNSFAHTWLSLNTGSSALHEGVMRSLYKRDTVKEGFEKAIELNPTNSVAMAGLASWYHHVPALFGGNQQKALSLIDQAIDLDPKYMVSRMLKAEFLISAEQFADAVKELEALVTISKPRSRWQGTKYKLRAKALIKKLRKDLSS